MKKLLCIPLILLLVLPLVTAADDVDELYNAAIALIRAESYAAALTLLESAVKEQPNSPQIRYALGFVREKQGVESDAISSYLMAVKIALQLRLKDKKVTKQESRGAINAFQALDRLTPGRTAVLRKARDLAEQSLDMHGTDRRIVNEAVRKLRSIAFETDVDAPAPAPAPAPKAKEVPRNAQSFNGNWYKVYADGNGTWEDAKRRCERRGGHLVQISSVKEEAFVVELLNERFRNGTAYLGLSLTDRGWQWVTGDRLTYKNWTVGGKHSNADDAIVTLNLYKDDTIGWIKCDPNEKRRHTQYYVCEWR